MSKTKGGEIGWREYLALPELGVDSIKAKVDTGALTSAIHATDIQVSTVDGDSWVEFTVLPSQFSDVLTTRCRAPLVGYRKVRNSGGVQDERAVIATKVAIGDQVRTIELTLASRTNMRFRMLLGRSGIPDGYHVIPGKSYLLGGFKGAHEFGEEEE
jgi:hypothetical protein